MGKKPRALHLKVSIDNKIFVLGTLSYNLRKKEVSFYFHRSNSSPDNQLDLVRGIQTDPIHHITWHEHVIHIRTMNVRTGKKNTLRQIQYSNGCLFPNRKAIVPMYVEGFFLNGDSSILCEDESLNWKHSSDEILVLDQKVSENFSLIFFLVPTEWITQSIMLGLCMQSKDGNEIPLFYLRNAMHQIGRIKAFDDWDMIVFTTPYTRYIPVLDVRLGNTYRLPDFESPVSSLTSILEKAKAKPSMDEETIQALYAMRNGLM